MHLVLLLSSLSGTPFAFTSPMCSYLSRLRSDSTSPKPFLLQLCRDCAPPHLVLRTSSCLPLCGAYFYPPHLIICYMPVRITKPLRASTVSDRPSREPHSPEQSGLSLRTPLNQECHLEPKPGQCIWTRLGIPVPRCISLREPSGT